MSEQPLNMVVDSDGLEQYVRDHDQDDEFARWLEQKTGWMLHHCGDKSFMDYSIHEKERHIGYAEFKDRNDYSYEQVMRWGGIILDVPKYEDAKRLSDHGQNCPERFWSGVWFFWRMVDDLYCINVNDIDCDNLNEWYRSNSAGRPNESPIKIFVTNARPCGMGPR